jgi:hypothetical protein
MLVYLIAIIFVIFAIPRNNKMNPELRKAYMGIICIYVIAIMGFRYRVGIDTMNYMTDYKRLPSLESLINHNFDQTRFEPGYSTLCALCRLITPEFWLLQMVAAAITNIGVFVFLYRYCKNPFIGVILYFIMAALYFNTEIIRESAAIAIFLLNYENLRKKRYLKYYLFCLLSISFHYSSFIILFFPLVKHIKFNIWYVAAVIAIIGVAPLLESLNQALAFASVNDRVDMYVQGADALNMNWRLGNLIKSSIIPALALLIMHKYKQKSDFTPFLLFNILMCAGAFSVPLIFSRFANYTTIFVVAYVSNLLVNKKVRLLVRHLFLCMFICIQLYSYVDMYQRWIPYVSIFNEHKVIKRELLWRQFN